MESKNLTVFGEFAFTLRVKVNSRPSLPDSSMMIIEKKVDMFKKTFTKKILFVSIFTVFGLVALQIPFTYLAETSKRFTLFDFFGPIAGGFIGSWTGVISVFLVQIINLILHGARSIDTVSIIRLFPTLFAVLYFGRKSRNILVVPILAILAFNLHPVGSSVWYFSLYWTIPLVCHLLRDKFLFARSLGATFTAHSVGGTIWMYTFNNPASYWVALIPVVFVERMMFALGISVAYLAMNNLLGFLMKKKVLKLGFSIDKRYLLGINKKPTT